ncbi:MAG TPA: energy transducer TonB [Steroidobacteraceae bacterium]
MASPASNASRSVEVNSGGSSPAPAASNRPQVDVTAITTRDDFLLELGDALGGQASVRPVDSIEHALDHISNTKRGQLLVIDSRDVTDMRETVERAVKQASHAVVLVFASADAEKQVGAAVKGSNVFAVLPIPIDPRKTGAVLEGAMSDAVAKRSNSRSGSYKGVSVESFQSQGEAAAGPSDSGSGASNKNVLMGVGAAVAIALAGGAYFLFSHGKQPSAPIAAAAKPAAQTPATAAGATVDDAALASKPTVETLVKGKVDELLEKARAAMRERRYTEPAGDNALLYYRSAAAADQSSGEAVDGMRRMAAVLAARYEESMTGGKFDDAAGALANFKVAAPGDTRIPGLELKLATAQINKALAEGNVDRAAALVRQAQQSSSIPADQLNRWRTDIGRRQEDAKLQRLAGLVEDRIRDGKLVDPSDDSAKTYMQQLHETAPTNPTTQRAARDLNSAYLRKAREATVSKNAADSDHWIAEARAGGVSGADLTNFQRDLASARQKAAAAEAERFVQLTRDRIKEGRLTDPAQDSAAFYLGQLQSTDASNGSFAQLSKELSSRLIDRARAAARDSSKAALVEADLTQAKRFGADARDIQSIQQSQSAARTPAATPRPSTALSPAAPPTMNYAQLAKQLKRTRYQAPQLPDNAKVGGVVTIEFTVDVKGDPRDIRVVDANPPGIFEKSATTAIKHWHYDPLVVNGGPVEIPVRISMRFEPPK